MKYIAVLICVIIGINANADAVNHRAVNIYKTQIIADTDTVIRKSSIIAGVSYGSDALFFGRTGPTTYPYISTDVIYNTKPGFFIYASGLQVLGYPFIVDEVDLGGGYFYKLSSKFSGTASYNRFVFNKNALVIQSAASNDINFKNAYDWKIVKSSIIVDYLFGKSNDIFLTLNLSKYYESKFSIFDDKDYLSINPGISFILGTQNFVQNYSDDHQFRQLENNLFNDNQTILANRNREFNALNYSFKIPIAYNRPHYTFEASYKYSIPVNVEGILLNHRESFYNLTFYYVFY